MTKQYGGPDGFTLDGLIANLERGHGVMYDDHAAALRALHELRDRRADEPPAGTLKCPTCKRPFEEVPTKGASTDPLACLHPVVMSNVAMDGSTNKWCYSCGAAL